MFDEAYYLKIKRKWQARLFNIPGVEAIGIGPKYINDRASGDLAILIYVRDKKPISSIKKKERIPAFLDNIATDVKLWAKPVCAMAQITVNNCAKGNVKSVKEVKDSSNTVIAMEIESTNHQLFEGEIVTFRGPTGVQGAVGSYKAHLIDGNNFSIDLKENGNFLAPINTPYTTETASWLSISTYDTLCCCPSADIQTVTTGARVEITSHDHGLHTNDIVKIKKTDRKLLPKIYKIKKIDKDNFTLVDAAIADFGGIPNGWKWFKVSLALTGIIKTYEKTNPIIIHSDKHGLKDGDKIVINLANQFIADTRLKNHLDESVDPYLVKKIDDNKFSLQIFDKKIVPTTWKTLDATSFKTPMANADIIASWIQVTDDQHEYSRMRGGIRIETNETVEYFTRVSDGHGGFIEIRRPAHMVRQTTQQGSNSEDSVAPASRKTRNVGTMGCIAIDKSVTPNKKVMLSNAHVMAANPAKKEVHHPTYYESSTDCSSNRKGDLMRFEMPKPTEAANALTVDAAISSINKDLASDPEIIDIGLIKGTHRITTTDIANGDFKVFKRGAMTRITEGIVSDVALTQKTPDDNLQWNTQILVDPIAGLTKGFMCVKGDSGSVLVDKDNNVVGLLHKGTGLGQCIASHIDDVETKLKIKIMKDGDIVADSDAGEAENEELAIRPNIPRLLTDTVAELTAAGGSEFVAMVQSHYQEVFTLVKTNKQFAFAWFHNHGPLLIKRLRIAIADRTVPMPRTIHDRPLQEFISNIFEAMKKYGSTKLIATVTRYESWLLKIMQASYEEILEHFQEGRSFQQNIKKAYSE